MNISAKTFSFVSSVLLAFTPLIHASTTTLLDESFANGSYGVGNDGYAVWKDTTVGSSGYGSTWTWSAVNGLSGNSPSDQETYNGTVGNMSARSMPVLPGNAGGFEVISDPNPVGVGGNGPGTWMVDTKVSVPTTFSTLQSADVSFDYGFRGSVIPSSFTLYDSTSQTSLFTENLTSSGLSTWSAADFMIGSAYLTSVKAGDTLDLQWKTTSSSSAVSLEVGGPVTFSVTSAPGAPAPSLTACLAFAGVLLLQALRRSRLAA